MKVKRIAGYVGGGVARGLFVGILVTAISLFFVPFQVHSWDAHAFSEQNLMQKVCFMRL